jgi:hypothetical protein
LTWGEPASSAEATDRHDEANQDSKSCRHRQRGGGLAPSIRDDLVGSILYTVLDARTTSACAASMTRPGWWMLRLASRISSGVGWLAGGYPISMGVFSMVASRQSDTRGIGTG